MAIKIKFDLFGNPEPPTIILANKNGNMLGQLNVNTDTIEVVDKLNDASEMSFTINKYINGSPTLLWAQVVDFKLIYCKEWKAWFEIKVELDEETETVKTVFCTQLGQAELSQLMLYNVEINTEKDIERDDYKISILYDPDYPEASILHRILKDKAPHYTIAYVSPTIAKIQRSFSFDGTSILDAFQEISKEIGCLFLYDAGIENGRLQRKISVFDLQQYCNDCGHRSERTDKCPKCDSINMTNGYGNDTLIFVTSDELASEGIQLVTDTDSVKNCFKLEAGDDLMTATIRSCNPNGTEYIWYFSDYIKEDMSDELVKKIESYNDMYKYQYNDSVSNINTNILTEYNKLVDKYSTYNKNLQKISTPIKGYSNLMNAYYNAIDLNLLLNSALMPSVEISKTSAKEQAALLKASSLSPVAVADIKIVSLATANSAVLAMAKVIVKSTFKVEIKSSELVTSGSKKYWKGSFIVTNHSDEEDVAESSQISIELNDSLETVTKQKIEKLLTKEDTDDLSITGLFKKGYDDFCSELKKYALNPLTSFYDACQACIDILIDQGVADKKTWSDNASGSEGNLYEKLYLPYYNKLKAIEAEIKIREKEISVVFGVYDADGKLVSNGLQTEIERCRNKIQDALDFRGHLGEELWLEFCAYRREDTYSNDNYISDGLNNAELFEKAREFLEVAENEIYKSSELRYSISTTLNNLLAIKKFKSLVDSFENGNWIRVQINDEIFKLRLIEYSIDFGNFEKISVEFSDVTKVRNCITDIESILSQSTSMSTSYDYIKRQSDKGDNAQGTISQWLASGLNSALVRIQNNNNEDIVLDRNGLLCRSYDDITEAYAPEQFRLTHNIMAYTTDNWETVSAALGKHEYTRWKNHEWIKDVDYGLSATFVTAGYVTGSQIIGGEIVSSNYKRGESGTYINLIDGDFEFAGGKIIYDTKTNFLNLKDVTINWDTTNDVPISSVDGLDNAINVLENAIDNAESNAKDYTDDQNEDLSKTLTEAYKQYSDSKVSQLDKTVADYLGVGGGTLVGSSFVISPYIGGGYLNITNTSNKSRVIIDPNNLTGNGYIFQVHNGKSVTVGIDSNGNSTFAGKITTSEGNIAGWNIVSGAIYKNQYDSASNKTYSAAVRSGNSTSSVAFALYEKDGEQTDAPSINNGWIYDFYVGYNGKLYAKNAEITGKITATSLTLSGCKVPATGISGLSTVATSGKYSDLSGRPTIPSSVADLGLDTSKIIYKGDIKQSTKTDSNGISYLETVVPTTSGSIKYSTYDADNYIVFGRSKGTNSSGKNYVCISKDGLLTARNALIYGTVYATDGEFTGKITGGTIDINNTFKVDAEGNITMNSGGIVKIAADEGEDSFINFGEEFAVSKNGLSAISGNFNSLTVNGQKVLTEDKLNSKIIVSKTQPNGNGIIWVCPSAASNIKNIEYKGYTADTRDTSLNISSVTKSFTVSCNSKDTLPSSTYKYTVRFPVALIPFGSYDATSESNIKFNVVAKKSGATVTFPTYTLSSIKKWEEKNIEISLETTTNLCANNNDITISISTQNVKSSCLFVNKEAYIYLLAADKNATSTGAQQCTVSYIP